MFITLLFLILGLCLLVLGGVVVLVVFYATMAVFEMLLEVFLPDWLRKHKE